MIHPTAVIHGEARLGRNVSVGPFAIIEANVVVGDDCRIYPHAVLTGHTTLGPGTEVHMGAVVGHVPQDKAFVEDEPTSVVIGSRTILREYVTIHRASRAGCATTIGDDCFLMAHAHVAHDGRVGDGVVICNNTVLAGYVEIGDRAFVSGNVSIHQFSRVGTLAMLGGGCQVGQDVPPYTTVAGRSQIRGLNSIGMRRAGIDAAARGEIKAAYRRLFAHRHDLAGAIATLNEAADLPEIRTMRDFYGAESRRGFAWPPRGVDDIDDDRRRASGGTDVDSPAP